MNTTFIISKRIHNINWILAIVLLFLIVFNACMPFMQMQTAQAQTFEQRIPSFGLYCKDKDVISSGAIKYDLSNTNTMQSTYQLAAVHRAVEFSIPFISSAKAPSFNVTASGREVSGSVWYGASLNSFAKDFEFETLIGKTYSPVIDENLNGTLYTIIPESDTVSIKLTFAEGENNCYVYETSDNFTSSNTDNGAYTWALNNALTNSEYKFFVLGEKINHFFVCSSNYLTETVSCKKFVDNQYESLKEIYDDYGVAADFLYSMFNSVLNSKLGIKYDELFLDSINAQRLNVYSFSLFINTATVVSYDLPINIQSNYTFSPPIYLVEQRNLGRYPVDLSDAIPYIIESSVKTLKNGATYNAETEDDYYFIFSSSEKVKNLAQDKNIDVGTTVIICCSVIGGIALIALIVLIGLELTRKAKRR